MKRGLKDLTYLEIVTELERIGDYVKGIAKISLLIGEPPLLKLLIDIPLSLRKCAPIS